MVKAMISQEIIEQQNVSGREPGCRKSAAEDDSAKSLGRDTTIRPLITKDHGKNLVRL
jgi:hypothetical protein